jgi:hypothetical protein
VSTELLHYKIGNVLVTRTALPVLTITELFDYWLELDVETYALGDEEHRNALDLAKRHRLTFYEPPTWRSPTAWIAVWRPRTGSSRAPPRRWAACAADRP